MADIKPIIADSFNQYAGAVLQSRALVDSRDCIKPSARQIFYSMMQRKLTHDKPHKKTANAVGMAMADYYIHGDASCEGVIMRAAQDFSMRYPLIDVKGNTGSLAKSGNWAAARYTESRTSALMDSMFEDINKNTINDWRDNYDNTKQYPGVLPTKGFYNLCNGSFGIGVGMSSSIPQFNIREMNEVLEKLLLNPNISDDEIIILPDFATGACLLNPAEVKESLKNGNGKSCLLRSVISYDSKENCLVVTEIPYSVYTNTICAELDAILADDSNPGIDRYNDLTGKTPLIKIYLNKNTNPNTILDFLYKNTSLQYWYAINLTMLDNGRYPKLFTWKEALQAHIEHEKIVYRRGFEFDKTKAEDRLHIVNGLLIALARIDEVIHTIKTSASTADANKELQSKFLLSEVQAKAILDMRLARLAKLEVSKLNDELQQLVASIDYLNTVLNNTNKFNECIIAGWRTTSSKFGDARRTKITPMEETAPTKIEDKDVVVLITEGNEVIVTEPFDKMNCNSKSCALYKKKIKMGCQAKLLDTIYAYDNCGQIAKIDLLNPSILPMQIVGLFNPTGAGKQYIIHVTNKGTVKKSLLSEYNFKRTLTVGKIREDEQVVFIGVVNNDDDLFILNNSGKILRVPTTEFKATGRNTIGVKSMPGTIIGATVAHENDSIWCLAEDKHKVTSAADYTVGTRTGTGQVVAENTVKLLTIPQRKFYLIENGVKITQFLQEDYIVKGKGAQGNKTTKDANIIW